MQENGLSRDPKKIEEIIETNFRTVTGKNLANELFSHA
jgi:hypothetical protein